MTFGNATFITPCMAMVMIVEAWKEFASTV
jgi:hypothetical protein